jgi:NAD-dependent SIR2 family protein deacetylase
MDDSLEKAHLARCEGKQGFRGPRIADRLAARASKKEGELIVSYKCVDCGLWHIGHADTTQIRAHGLMEAVFCVECGKNVPQNRYRILQNLKCEMTCSTACATRGSRRRLRHRRAARRRENRTT